MRAADDPDVLHQVDLDLARAREALVRAVDKCEALAELLSIADAVAASRNATTLTTEQLLASVESEQERATLLALSARAYPAPPQRPPTQED